MTSAVQLINAVLDDFHAAASEAEEGRYLGHLSPEAVFLGTDPGDRWQGEEFRTFVRSLFSQGKGWTYVPSARAVEIARDGRSAWFEERLENDWYGECRGTGILQLHDGGWKIEQYNLTIPIPDDLTKEFVARIREHQTS